LGYRITYKKSVTKDLRRLGKEEARRVLNKIESELSRNPASVPALSGRYAGLRLLRVGDYRVIFGLFEDEVLVFRIRHRKDAYRH